jgi:hypothetical protein
VRVAKRALDVGMIECLLHQLDVASGPEKLRADIVPNVVEPKVSEAGALA